MKFFGLKLTENDLLKIIEYIAQDNPGNALKILEKSRRRLQICLFFPKKFRIVPELV